MLLWDKCQERCIHTFRPPPKPMIFLNSYYNVLFDHFPTSFDEIKIKSIRAKNLVVITLPHDTFDISSEKLATREILSSFEIDLNLTPSNSTSKSLFFFNLHRFFTPNVFHLDTFYTIGSSSPINHPMEKACICIPFSKPFYYRLLPQGRFLNSL